jgi:hypothetical protein
MTVAGPESASDEAVSPADRAAGFVRGRGCRRKLIRGLRVPVPTCHPAACCRFPASARATGQLSRFAWFLKPVSASGLGLACWRFTFADPGRCASRCATGCLPARAGARVPPPAVPPGARDDRFLALATPRDPVDGRRSCTAARGVLGRADRARPFIRAGPGTADGFSGGRRDRGPVFWPPRPGGTSSAWPRVS